MGVESVEYHQATVVGRADDHPGQALDYYASRGETPLGWHGAAAARLGLVGAVTLATYEAAFGPGGFRDPVTGERLVTTTRPGFELVVAAPKSAAVLGVIGRADDMHAILDAETAATMAWLDGWFQVRGGRRGRAATPTPTTGLIYAATRHGTSRAGDPFVHDHVLIPNVSEMLDAKGGYKALFSALLRDTIEAATMVGRLHSAAQAIKLGYAIDVDHGPSGRLRHWRIQGIPAEVCALLSKRSDEIAEYLAEQGHVGYHARNVAARATRAIKRHTGIDELMPRWHAELTEIGWSVDRLTAALDGARLDWVPLASSLTTAEIDQVTARLLDVDGEFLARGKVFTRTRLIAEVAPMLYGHDPAELDPVIDRILASALVVPLIGVAGAREQPYTAAEVLATEQAIADCLRRLTEQPGPRLHPARILAAIAATQDEIGAELTDGQYAAVNVVCGSGRAVDVLVGIAGSGKTTALDAATSALESAGHQVIGTATSGQAAQLLGRETLVEARTMRSLLWRLDHGRVTLDRRSVVILDEAGMTADADMARLLLAVEAAGAKVVIVGDDRQLSAVGPGGALHATLQNHPEIITTLTQNLRQRDPAERTALLDLRAGNLDAAIDFYATHERIVTAVSRTEALAAMVDAWATDTRTGHDTLMLAWRRTNVADLNRIARHKARQLGWLHGDDLELPDGRAFAVGDFVVALAPNYRGDLVTSQGGTVIAVDHNARALTIRTDNREVTLLGTELDAERLAHGYALTVHREQGATTDRTHYFVDGGDRELAYVAMSRARDRSTVHAVADTLDQAVDDITRDWATEQRDQWLTPAAAIGVDASTDAAGADRTARRARLIVELEQLRALEPPGVTSDLTATMARLDQLRTRADHLAAGAGPYHHTPAGRIARQLQDLDGDIHYAQTQANSARWPWERRRWERLIDRYHDYQAATREEWDQHGQPEAARLAVRIRAAEQRRAELQHEHRFNQQWHRDHPEHVDRVAALTQQLHDLDNPHLRSELDDVDEPATSPSYTGVDRSSQQRAAIDTISARLDHIQGAVHPPEPDIGLGL